MSDPTGGNANLEFPRALFTNADCAELFELAAGRFFFVMLFEFAVFRVFRVLRVFLDSELRAVLYEDAPPLADMAYLVPTFLSWNTIPYGAVADVAH